MFNTLGRHQRTTARGVRRARVRRRASKLRARIRAPGVGRDGRTRRVRPRCGTAGHTFSSQGRTTTTSPTTWIQWLGALLGPSPRPRRAQAHRDLAVAGHAAVGHSFTRRRPFPATEERGEPGRVPPSPRRAGRAWKSVASYEQHRVTGYLEYRRVGRRAVPIGAHGGDRRRGLRVGARLPSILREPIGGMSPSRLEQRPFHTGARLHPLPGGKSRPSAPGSDRA